MDEPVKYAGPVSLLAVLGIIGAACAAITGLAVVARGAWRATRRIVHISDAVRELAPNGGTSLKDQVGRIENRLTAVEDALGVDRAHH